MSKYSAVSLRSDTSCAVFIRALVKNLTVDAMRFNVTKEALGSSPVPSTEAIPHVVRCKASTPDFAPHSVGYYYIEYDPGGQFVPGEATTTFRLPPTEPTTAKVYLFDIV